MKPDQLIQKSREKQVLDELVGTLKYDSLIQQWKFELREDYNSIFVLANKSKNTIAIILESPHKAEFEDVNLTSVSLGKINSRPLNNPSTRSSLYRILNSISFNSEYNSRLDNTTIYNITLVNAVQFQCSLGELPSIYRDQVFIYNWIEYQNNFVDRIKEIAPVLIINCCTKGTWINEKYLDIDRLKSYDVDELLDGKQLYYSLCDKKGDFSLKDLVECKLVVENLVTNSNYFRFNHPSSFNNKAIRSVQDSDKSLIKSMDILHYFVGEEPADQDDTSIIAHNDLDFKELLNVLSEAHLLSEDFLAKFEKDLNWEKLSRNRKLNWSLSLIQKFEDNWNFDALSDNESIPFTFDLIDQFINKWNWKNKGNWNGLTAQKFIYSSEQNIEHYSAYVDWGALTRFGSLRSEFIIKHWNRFTVIDYKGWLYGPIHWTRKLIIEKFRSKLYLYLFTSSICRFDSEVFENEWLFEEINFLPDGWEGFSSNEKLPWSIELIEKYINKWDWESLSVNKGLPWSDELVLRYAQRWKTPNVNEFWSTGIQNNEAIDWSLNLHINLAKHRNEKIPCKEMHCAFTTQNVFELEEHLDFNSLSDNTEISWTEELVERYKDRWNWNRLSSGNLPWGAKFITKYLDKWDSYFLCSNPSIQCDKKLIEEFEEFIDWNGIGLNKTIHWNVDFIRRFENSIDWDCFKYSLARIMNQQNLDEVLAILDVYGDRFDWGFAINEGIEELLPAELIYKYSGRITSKLNFMQNIEELEKLNKDDLIELIINFKKEFVNE